MRQRLALLLQHNINLYAYLPLDAHPDWAQRRMGRVLGLVPRQLRDWRAVLGWIGARGADGF